jgi:hypothetical protein
MSDQPPISAAGRRLLFQCGIGGIGFAAVGVVISFVAPFSSDGPHLKLDAKVLAANLIMSIFISILGAFGRGVPRFLVVGAGPLLSLLAILGYVGNHA